MAFATVEEVATRAGEQFTEDETQTVELLLDAATELIRNEVEGSDQPWVTNDAAEVPAAVRNVCIEVTYRAWSNPDALARAEVGDVSAYYRPGAAPDALWLTDRERRIVQRAAKRSAFRAVTLESPYSGPADEDPLDL